MLLLTISILVSAFALYGFFRLYLRAFSDTLPEAYLIIKVNDTSKLEHTLKTAVSKHPDTDVVIICGNMDEEAKKILSCLRRKYPFLHTYDEYPIDRFFQQPLKTQLQ